MANGYSLPPWLTPQRAPWEALIAGVQAGSAIAANRQRGRALAAQSQHQAFQDSVLQQKFDADKQDLQTLQQWWPTFSNAEGDALQKLQVPPLKNAQLWNNIQLEVGKKKQQAAASDLASKMGGLDLSTPQGQASYYALAAQAAKTGLPMTLEQIQAPVFKAQELKRLQTIAEETAKYHGLMVTKTPQKVNLAEAQRLERIADALEPVDPEEAQRYRQDASVMRASIPTAAGVVGDVTKPTTSTKSQIQQRMLTADKSLELGSQLLSRLTESDVGVRGNINQVLINEGLAQVLPGLSKGSVTEARTLLGQFNEQAIKAIASDPRISDKDRQRYEQILPKLGPVESLSSAQDKIKTFMQKFRDQTRTDAKAANLPVPNWALTPDEIKAKKESGELSYDDAAQLLIKYHGYQP